MSTPVGFNNSKLANQVGRPSGRAMAERKSSASDVFGSVRGEEVSSTSAPKSVSTFGSSKPVEKTSSPTEFKSALSNKTESPVRKEVAPAPKDEMFSGESLEGADTEMTISAVKPETKLAAHEPVSEEHAVPMTSFLEKMQKDFDVSPEEIVSAFKSLSKEELAAPPEQNVNKLVEQLGLNPQEALVAAQMFKQVLVQTDAAKPEVQPAPMRMGEGLEALSMLNMKEASAAQPQAQAQVKDQSLAQMSNSFFMKPAPKAEPTEKAELLAAPFAKEQLETSEVEGAESSSEGIEIPEEMLEAKPVDLSKEEIAAVKARINQAPEKAEKKSLIEPQMAAIADEQATQAPAAQLAAAPVKAFEKQLATAADTSTSNEAVAQAAQTPQFAVPTFAKSGSNGSDFASKDDDKKSDISAVEGDDQVAGATPFVAPTAVTTEAKIAKGEGPIAPMAPHEVLEHAHVMVKDGGGEMKVMLRPDGLGEVQMKVTVKDGKVAVQLVTQSDEAKNILEHSFKGLKEGLSVHHLNLESIKVDTASSAGNQLDNQMKDQSHEQQKQQARQFFEQFNQDNGGWRRSQFDIPGADVYRSQSNTRPGLDPSAIASRTAAASRRLNLVA